MYTLRDIDKLDAPGRKATTQTLKTGVRAGLHYPAYGDPVAMQTGAIAPSAYAYCEAQRAGGGAGGYEGGMFRK